MKRFLSSDPFTGIMRWVEYDSLTDELHESAVADAEPNIEYAKALRNDEDYWKQGVKKDMAHYAHIPNILLEQWIRLGVDVNDPDALIAMVNKPEYAYLRTTTKRHE